MYKYVLCVTPGLTHMNMVWGPLGPHCEQTDREVRCFMRVVTETCEAYTMNC